MAHWSSTGFDQYARYESRNAKPRWQELAELSSPFSSVTSSTVPNLEHMDRAPDYDDSGTQGETRSSNNLQRYINARAAERDATRSPPDASRSRSRSRPGRPRTRILGETSTNRHRSKSVPRRNLSHAFMNRVMFISMLAMVNILLSWSDIPNFSFPQPIVRYVERKVWMPSSESLNTGITRGVCKLPLVPRILSCNEMIETDETTRKRSIRHAIPDIVFALSENPDTVDGILDLLEEIKKELLVIQTKIDMSSDTTEPLETPESLASRSQRSEFYSGYIKHFLETTTYLEDRMTEFDAHKDKLLDALQLRLYYLNLEYKYMSDDAHGLQNIREDRKVMSWPQYRNAIVRDLDGFATSIDLIQQDQLEAFAKLWEIFLEESRRLLDSEDEPTGKDESVRGTRALQDRTFIRTFILWYFPFINNLSVKKDVNHVKEPTAAERKQLILGKLEDIRPLLRDLHASISKAHSSAQTGRKLIRRNSAWSGPLLGMFTKGQWFDVNMTNGMRETSALVPMLMEQRKGQRADRLYKRSMARAKGDGKNTEGSIPDFEKELKG